MNRLYAWTHDLHFYLGLFLCPFLLVFAVSTLLLNHPSLPPPEGSDQNSLTNRPVELETRFGHGSLEQARSILRQLGVTGEIAFVRHLAREQRLVIPVDKPGEAATVEVDLRTGTATVRRQPQGLGAALIYLHKKPGPHNVKFHGNWVYMAWWSALADTVVYVSLFLTLSGLCLWWLLKPERAAGWVFLGAGALSVAALVAALCAA